MGKYALGNAKNSWSDRFWDINPGDFVLTYWQSNEEDEVSRSTTRRVVYEVVSKTCRYRDSAGMVWRLRDTISGNVHDCNINLLWDQHLAYSRKLNAEEIAAYKQTFSAEGLAPPPRKAFDLRVDYRYEFNTQGGKYPRPAKPKQYLEPNAGDKYRLMNHREGDFRYDVIVEGIELWGTGNPRAVAYKRVGSDTLERRTVDYFRFNFHAIRD